MAEIPYTIVIGIFGLTQAVVVSVIAGLFGRESKKRKADNSKQERRSEIRAEESRLAMALMSANARLASATGIALKEGRVNGKMDLALEEAEKAQVEYHKFINKVASKQVAAD